MRARLPRAASPLPVTLPPAPRLMGTAVIGPVQPDAVRADPEVLHQGGGTAKIGGAMPDPGLPCTRPAGGSARIRTLRAGAAGVGSRAARADARRRQNPCPGMVQFGHQDAAIGQGGEAVDALAKRSLRPLGQKLLRIDQRKGPPRQISTSRSSALVKRASKVACSWLEKLPENQESRAPASPAWHGAGGRHEGRAPPVIRLA